MSDITYSGGLVRLHVEVPLGTGAPVTLEDSQAHYLLNVMRAGKGDSLRLFNGRDGEWLAEIAETFKRKCILICTSKIGEQLDVPDLWLVFAPVKKTPSDYLAQKATELGVRVLQPVITRRTIVSRVNDERMLANAIEAAEQSGRVSVPEVRPALSLEKLLGAWPTERRLVYCDEAGDAKPLTEALCTLPDGPFAILTGPEGGFDPAERAMIRSFDFTTPVTLGARILRADTAALAALAVWQTVKGDWR